MGVNFEGRDYWDVEGGAGWRRRARERHAARGAAGGRGVVVAVGTCVRVRLFGGEFRCVTGPALPGWGSYRQAAAGAGSVGALGEVAELHFDFAEVSLVEAGVPEEVRADAVDAIEQH